MKTAHPIKPFLKWAGGKRQLLPEILQRVPASFRTYYEPFVGGGAVLFALQPQRAVINDCNLELVNCYRTIRDDVQALIAALETHREHNSADYYYQLRDRDRVAAYVHQYDAIARAARIIYLNKTCYNGLFRVNSRGQFNVPFGRHKKPNIVDEEVLAAISRYLSQNDIEIANLDFAAAVESAGADDFVYFDPPYDPVSSTASFTGYDLHGFNRREQERLKATVDRLTARRCKVLLSNACTDFIVNLYQEYPQERVTATRAINSNSAKRGKVDELLVKNYS